MQAEAPLQQDSSDPSSTHYSSEESGEGGSEGYAQAPPKVEVETVPAEAIEVDDSKLPHVMIFCIDALIPLMLILSAISAMSFTGILFLLLLYLHLFTANKIRATFAPLRACLVLDFCVNLAVFVFSLVSYFVEFKQEAVRVVGLDFNNIISSTPTLNLVTSVIAMICQAICLKIMGQVKIGRIVELRRAMFGALTFQFGMDLVWAVCNAFNAASNSSYLYFPILIYFVYSNICQSLFGTNGCPAAVLRYVMRYSLFFAVFELYMVSYIGEKWNPSKLIKYVYIAPESTKAVNVVIAAIFAYLSVQQMSAPGLTVGKKRMPQALKVLSDRILILAFMATFLFGMLYPNYLSLTWLWIPFNASFASLRTVKAFFLPLLTIVFTLSFVVMAVTSFELFNGPKPDGKDHRPEFLRLFGLYRYPKDFTFTVVGFYIICLLGQIGRITHVAPTKTEEEAPPEEEPEDPNEPEDIRNARRFLREERQRKLAAFKAKLSAFCEKAFSLAYSTFGFAATGGIIVLSIVAGFYKDRWAFKVICALFMAVCLCALYKRAVFEFLKFVSGMLLIIAAFYTTTINSDCLGGLTHIQDSDLEGCLTYAMIGDVDLTIKLGLVPPIGTSLFSFSWSMLVTYVLATFLTANPDAMALRIHPSLASITFLVVGILHFVFVFLYKTTIWTILFLIAGLILWWSMY
jgi:hypothetical protein